MSSSKVLYKGNRTDIILVEEGSTQKVVKVLQDEYPDPNLIEQFNNEYKLTHGLKIEGVRKALKVGSYKGRQALWLEYIEGDSLSKIASNNLSLEKFLDIAVRITQTLVNIHQAKIIHKDINPYNILLHKDTGEICFIDFGVSSTYNTKQLYEHNPNKIEGNLLYIAPEQTGRMNRSVDVRSDLYSLGATFYELLTAQVPFNHDSPAELIHAHIAKQPTRVNKLRPNIPGPLANLVHKLLTKNAEGRYQSAQGLLHDLLFLRDNLGNLEALQNFKLAQKDYSLKLTIPEKLYGREEELDALVDASTEMAFGNKSVLLISGSSGAGKSFLVHEVHKTMRAGAEYYFIEGKFDQHQRNIPYSAWIQAFKMLSQSLMTLEDKTLARVKKRILELVGQNGRVLTEVIPSLEVIIGKQPEIPELSGIEAQNRFNYTFQRFITALVEEECPLVLFIDDLQWADLASLKLFKAIATDRQSNHLLILGAYRSNEVDATHPFITSVEEMKSEGVDIKTLHLSNLKETDIEQILLETTHNEEDSKELASLIFQKTQGNAFFINQFIQSLYVEGLITHFQESGMNKWVWNITQIYEKDITSNVVELMVSKVERLSDKARSFLKPMACIGSKVSKKVLEILLDSDHTHIEEVLEKAFRDGVLHKGKDYYKFTHDRIQQAVYSMLKEEEQQQFHLKIAEILYLQINNDDSMLFEVTNQYNQALSLVKDEAKQKTIGELNIRAGIQAKQSSAYAAARSFLNQALSLLNTDNWEMEEEKLFQLYRELADVEYLNGNFEQSQAYVAHVLQHAKAITRKAEIYNMLIVQHTFQSEFAEALKVGVQALDFMQEPLPTTGLQEVLGAEIQQMQLQIGDQSIESLIKLPRMQNEEKVIATQLLVNLIPVAYLSGQMELYAVVSAKIINLGLKYGHSPASSHGYSNYGGVVAAMMGQYEMAYQFGKLAMQLTEKFNNMYLRCKDSMLFANFMSPWVQHIRESDRINKEGFQLGLESGEMQYPGYISMFQVMEPIFQGEKLQKVLADAEEYIRFTNKTKHQWVNDGIVMMKYGVRNLLGRTDGLLSFNTDHFDESEHEQRCMERSSFNGVAFYHIMKAQTAYLYGQPEVAVKHLEGATEVMPAIAGMIFTASYNFYYSLSLLQLENALEHLDKVKANQEQMEKWASSSPDNFLHKKLLVEAELARVQGDHWNAVELYRQSITEAKKQGFIQNEAIAHELLATFWKELGEEDYFVMHINKAFVAFKSWGAIRKVSLMQDQHYEHISVTPLSKRPSSSRATEYTSSDFLDIQTIVKAVESFTSETNSDLLLEKMIRIVVENAGAQKGVMLLPKGKSSVFKPKVIYDIQTTELLDAKENDIAPEKTIPQQVINLVARSKEQLIIGNAAEDPRFQHDEYIMLNHVQSVLCMPMVHAGKTSAILYLENNLTPSAFRSKQLYLLNILSTQIAISIDNTSLYENLEEKVSQRTKELQKKNRDITASINYGSRIQEAILPSKEQMKEHFKDITLFFRPRDIVSGDFYWFAHIKEENLSIAVAADCTGHGVPGAFMSMIGDSLLNRIVYDKEVYLPDLILAELNLGMREALNKRRSKMHDGMDVALVTVDHNAKKLHYAGAKNPLIYVKNRELHTIKASKYAIGDIATDLTFQRHTLDLAAVDMLYMFSDGYQDQFGGPGNRRFMRKQLKALLQEISHYDASMQESILANTLSNWTNNGEVRQIDDILILGIRP